MTKKKGHLYVDMSQFGSYLHKGGHIFNYLTSTKFYTLPNFAQILPNTKFYTLSIHYFPNKMQTNFT